MTDEKEDNPVVGFIGLIIFIALICLCCHVCSGKKTKSYTIQTTSVIDEYEY